MRKARFLCTAICAFALCGFMLTGCEKGNEATESETEISETSVTSESVSETVKTEAETVTEITEAEEMKEYDPVPESTLNYDKIKDRVIFEDGENTLTAGQYIDALENFDGFINGFYYYYIFQIMDMDKNGIPEILLSRDDTVFVCSELCTVTAEGKSMSVQIANHDVYYDIGQLRGGPVQPYEKDGETLWISHFNTGGAGGGTSGNCLLKYNGSGIDGEVINESTYVRDIGYEENGDWYWDYNYYYYIFGEEVTEEEYDRRRDEYMNSLKPSDELYVESSYDEFERLAEYEFRENLSYTLNKYLDMRDGTYKDAYTQLADKKVGDIAAQEYVDSVMNCYDFTESGFSFQLADLNSDGMPEVIAYVNEHYRSATEYFSVSADGKAALLPVQKNKLNDSDHIDQDKDSPDTLIGKWVQGYEKDGETVWVGSFENRHAPYNSVIEEAYGDYILKFDGKTVSQEILREHDVVKSSIIDYLDIDKYYWNDKEVTEEEYEQLYRKFIWDMEPLYEMNLYVSKQYCNRDTEQKNLLAAAVLEYIENQRAAERRIIYNNGTEKLTAERYINALENCAEFTDISMLYRIQLADVNNDGIPEALALAGEFEDNTLDIFFVSARGEVRKISVEKDAAFKWVTPYEKDGKIIWIADTVSDSFSGEAVLHISDNSARLEEICSESYIKKEYFWQGQSVSYQEYEKLHEDYFGAMDNSAEIYAISAFDYWTRTTIEKLSDVMEEYLQSMPYTYNEIKDTVLYSDEKNSLTVGQYIDAVVKCRDFTELYKNGIQLADLNGDGIPEAIARIAAFPITSYFSVSAEGEAFMLYDKNGESQIEAELPEPYEKDGKILWLSHFYDGGSGSGGGGDSILKYEDGIIKKEIIRCYYYQKNYDTFDYDYTYYWGSDGYWDDTQGVEVSEEEYESRYEALLAEMQPVEAGRSVNRVYGGSTFQYYELKELLAEMLKECLEL